MPNFSATAAAPKSFPFFGKKSVTIDGLTFPPELLASDLGTVTLTPGTVEFATQAGTTNIPNGTYDDMSVTLTFMLPDISVLGEIFPGLTKVGTAGSTPEAMHDLTSADFEPLDEDGRVDMSNKHVRVSFANEDNDGCATLTAVPVEITNICGTSKQTIEFPRAMVQAGLETSLSRSDPPTVEITISALPGAGGGVVFDRDVVTDDDSEAEPEPETVSITADSTVSVAEGGTATVNVTVTGSTNTAYTAVSAAEGTATVTGNTITGIAAGTTTVTWTASADTTKTATTEVTVTAAAGDQPIGDGATIASRRAKKA